MSFKAQQTAFTLTLASFSLIFLVFLIFLNTLAKSDTDKLNKALLSIQKQFPSSNATTRTNNAKASSLVLPRSQMANNDSSQDALKELLEENGFSTRTEQQALVAEIPVEQVFSPGSDQIKARLIKPFQVFGSKAAKSNTLLYINIQQKETTGNVLLALSELELAGAQAASFFRLMLDAGVSAALMRSAGSLLHDIHRREANTSSKLLLILSQPTDCKNPGFCQRGSEMLNDLALHIIDNG